MKPTLSILLSLIIGLSLGCSGSGSDSSGEAGNLSSFNPGLSGYVADGYLRNALVFLDINGNKKPDSDEPQTTTVAGGYYELDPGTYDASLYPVAVQVVAGVTIDEDNPGEAIESDYLLEAPRGRHGFISPLTTLVNVHMEQNPSTTVQDAETHVRLALNLGNELTLFEDYIAGSSGGNSALERSDALKCYNAARIVADLMESIHQAMRTNLGSAFDSTAPQVIQFIAADRIMAQAEPIQIQVADGSQLLAEGAIEAIVDAIEDDIAPESLGASTVAIYQSKIAEGAEVWDATPPALTHCSPAEGQLAPVDTRVILAFDEELDPSSIDNGCLTLSDGQNTITGSVQYDSQLKTLTLVPGSVLNSFTTYTVQFSPQVRDQVGNAVPETHNFTFTTIFDGSPPPPPDFG